MSFSATYLGSSGWKIIMENKCILIDPWLTGDLTFSPGPWLIKGQLKNDIEITEQIDLLLLTQGLADHTHQPTLESLSKQIEVIGSKSAAKVAIKLGYKNVSTLLPGMSKKYTEIKVTATEGAAVPNIENGYIVCSKNSSFYIEPHGFLEKKLRPNKTTAVFTPVINLNLPIAGSFINGKRVLNEIIDKFEPKYIFASTTGGDSKFSGILNNLIEVDGSIEEAKNNIPNNIKLIDPIVGKTYNII